MGHLLILFMRKDMRESRILLSIRCAKIVKKFAAKVVYGLIMPLNLYVLILTMEGFALVAIVVLKVIMSGL